MKSLIRQVSVVDQETGEVVQESWSQGSQNGRGWVIMYTDKVNRLLKECSGSTFKVFSYLAMGQQFEEKGMITTKKAVQEELGMTKKTCLEAFKWLKEHMIIHELRANGVTEFMVNPEYVTVGRNKRARERVWVNRWHGEVVSTVSLPENAPKDIRRKRLAKARRERQRALPAGRSITVED